ncbi:MAG: DUF2914 domain-containing protein [Myxococcota bacterium]
MKTIALVLVAALALPALAAAEEAVSGTFDIVDVKVCSAIMDRECTTEQSTFNTGDKAWVWLKLRPKDETATMSMKWTWDGKDVWTMDPTPVRHGRTWYYKTFDQPGEWKVEILDNNNTSLHTATMTVAGEPIDKMAEAPAAEGEEAGDVVESAHVAVIDLKLAEEIKDREPVSPGTTFTTGAKVYTWVKLHVKEAETSVKLKWYRGDALVYTSDAVNVKQSPGWRTWLYKTVDTAGAWKVEVVDADDMAIHRQEFSVQ